MLGPVALLRGRRKPLGLSSEWQVGLAGPGRASAVLDASHHSASRPRIHGGRRAHHHSCYKETEARRSQVTCSRSAGC